MFSEISINNPNGRYRLTEEHESLYSYKVALTINRVSSTVCLLYFFLFTFFVDYTFLLTIFQVARTDLGNYTCGARNSYGTVRGTISLKSIMLKFFFCFKT